MHWNTCILCGMHICLGVCANSVKCGYISVHVHIVDYGGFLWGM